MEVNVGSMVDRRRAGRGVRRRRGAAVVETAIVLPIAIMLILGVFDFSRVIAMRQVLQNAAKDGGRYAVVRAVDATTTDGQVIQYVQGYLAGVQGQLQGFVSSRDIQVFKADPATGANIGSWKDAGFGEYIGVRISGTMKLAVLKQVTLTVQSTQYSEAN
ncbi:TadE-like protein [Aquisphaera giovannonii]|uniref:TadE-like protein n=1 Tax=Aquisphaera giovannonii TaxID=406548 RepID=A0A5B9W5R9_9BACT|nr:TadE/TadG family type IV pilus assembly protein [Aquisphaera giovannonii]QEH35992.1 TadE-like protein [Aquisphaera giovannonii]